MVLVHFLFALGTAVILSLIFMAGFGGRKAGPSVPIFFILILLVSWAGGIWLTPIGPPLWEAYWLPFLIVGLIFALVLVAVAAPPSRRSTVELVEPVAKEAEKRAIYWTVGIFFWFLIVVLIIAIVWRYV
jgi:hypothetical protein